MAICNSCGGVYYWLFDPVKNKEVAVNERSISKLEYFGIIRKIQVPFDSNRHKLHILTCKRNIKIDKRPISKQSSINNNKDKKKDGISEIDFFSAN